MPPTAEPGPTPTDGSGAPQAPAARHDPASARHLPLRKRLSYKQARNTALLTIVVGIIVSTLQIVVDLMQLERKTDALVHQVLRSQQETAAEAAYAFDKALAGRVLDGLFEYRQIRAAGIDDDFGNQLAQQQRPLTEGLLRGLSDLLLGSTRQYQIPLVIARHGQTVGELKVEIDHYLIAIEFFERSSVIVFAGILWTITSAGILVAMFYVSLTKPFLRMARAIAQVDPAQPAAHLLNIPRLHADDELGLLARTTNELLLQFDQSLERRQQAEARLREREARLRGIMENVADGIITLDDNYRVESMNRAALDLFGCETTKIIGRPLADFIDGADWRRVQVALSRSLDRTDGRASAETRQELNGRRSDGDVVPIYFSVSQMRLGSRITFICVVQDITERKRAERALRESEERLKLAVTATRSGVWDYNLQTGEYWWSREFVRVLGYEEDELMTASYEVWESLVHPDDLPWCKALAERYLKGEVPDYQPVYRMRRKDGSWVWIEDKAHAVRDDTATAIRFTGTMADVTERKRFEEQLMYMATHDPLTNLPNRTLLQDRLSHARNLARRKGSVVAVLFIDLDRFKLINESLGHHIGDELLRTVAQTLASAVRATDTVGRLGGDEFLVIAEDLEDPQDAGRIAKGILHALTRPTAIEGHQLFVTPSIGISIYIGDDTDMPALLRHADTAMHSAKAGGGNTYRFFIPEMNEEAVARLALEHSLREAVEQEQFQVYYQPKVDLATLRPIGLEALVRWRHPDKGMVSPATFIPIAEEMGLIVAIGEWVLKSSLRQIRDWQNRGIPPLPIAVNVSVRQLTSGVPVKTIADLLQDTGVSPELLELEITESVMMDNLASIIESLRGLRGLGLKIAVDDFGTGYSSLSYLRRLPITALKVDRSFISDVTTNADDAAIAATIIAMGHQLGLKVVAEGIETPDQLAFLQRHHCDEAQGFLIAKPMPAAELEQKFLHGGQWITGTPAGTQPAVAPSV